MEKPRFKLYHFPGSRSARVKWMLHEVLGDVPRRRISGKGSCAADCVAGHNVKWARGYGLCQDEVFRGYLSRVSKRPAFVKAFADTR